MSLLLALTSGSPPASAPGPARRAPAEDALWEISRPSRMAPFIAALAAFVPGPRLAIAEAAEAPPIARPICIAAIASITPPPTFVPSRRPAPIAEAEEPAARAQARIAALASLPFNPIPRRPAILEDLAAEATRPSVRIAAFVPAFMPPPRRALIEEEAPALPRASTRVAPLAPPPPFVPAARRALLAGEPDDVARRPAPTIAPLLATFVAPARRAPPNAETEDAPPRAPGRMAAIVPLPPFVPPRARSLSAEVDERPISRPTFNAAFAPVVVTASVVLAPRRAPPQELPAGELQRPPRIAPLAPLPPFVPPRPRRAAPEADAEAAQRRALGVVVALIIRPPGRCPAPEPEVADLQRPVKIAPLATPAYIPPRRRVPIPQDEPETAPGRRPGAQALVIGHTPPLRRPAPQVDPEAVPQRQSTITTGASPPPPVFVPAARRTLPWGDAPPPAPRRVLVPPGLPPVPIPPPPPLPSIPAPLPFTAQLEDEGGPVDLRGKTVLCRTQSADRRRQTVLEPAEVVDALIGLVRKTWMPADLARTATGDMLLQFIVVDGAGRRRTYPGGGRYFHQEITRRPGDTRR